MAIIYSYPLIGELASGDTIAISDASNGNKTKSVTVGQLDSYINMGQATIIQVDDRVVTGASFNTGSGLLTLTRNSGDILPVTTNLDGRYALTSSLATVATSGSYNDLSNKPTIPAAYTNADVDAHLNTSEATPSQVLSWTGSDYDWVEQSGGGGGGITEITTTAPITGGSITTTGTIGITQASTNTNGYLSSTDWNTFNNKSSFDGQYSSLTGAPALATVATSGSYNDLSNKPTIPTNNNQLTNGASYTTNLGVVESLTTTGSSGAATLTNGILNIPQYSGGGGSGTVTSVDLTAGALINVSGGPITTSGSITVDVDLSELTDMTDPMISTDEFVVLDTGVQKRKEASEIGLSIFNNDSNYTTNLGVVQTLTTTGTSGAATLVGGTLNIPQYSGGGSGDTYDLNAGTKSGNSVPLNLTSGTGTDNSVVNITEGSNVTITQTSATEITIASTGGTVTGAWQTLNRTFTGSELVNAFSGNATDKITLVSVGANEIISLGFCNFICKANTTGTTNYVNTGNALYVVPENTSSLFGVIIDSNLLGSQTIDQIYQKGPSTARANTNTNNRPVGADLILGNPGNQSSAVNITQGDREFIIQVTYRITNF